MLNIQTVRGFMMSRYLRALPMNCCIESNLSSVGGRIGGGETQKGFTVDLVRFYLLLTVNGANAKENSKKLLDCDCDVQYSLVWNTLFE